MNIAAQLTRSVTFLSGILHSLYLKKVKPSHLSGVKVKVGRFLDGLRVDLCMRSVCTVAHLVCIHRHCDL